LLSRGGQLFFHKQAGGGLLDDRVMPTTEGNPTEQKHHRRSRSQRAPPAATAFRVIAFVPASGLLPLVGITRFVQQSAAGLLMEKSWPTSGKQSPIRRAPLWLFSAAPRVSDKIEVVENLMKIADAMLIGGGMAYTFLKAEGQPIGKSLVEEDKLELVAACVKKRKQRKFALLLPVDHLVGREFKSGYRNADALRFRHPDGWMGLDIVPRPSTPIARKLPRPKPLFGMAHGRIRNARFRQGTLEVAKPSPQPLAAAPPRSSVVVTRSAGSIKPAWQTKFRTSRPEAAPPSNFSRTQTPRVEAPPTNVTAAFSVNSAHSAYSRKSFLFPRF